MGLLLLPGQPYWGKKQLKKQQNTKIPPKPTKTKQTKTPSKLKLKRKTTTKQPTPKQQSRTDAEKSCLNVMGMKVLSFLPKHKRM